ncbi:PspC domain-containing protein [Carboxylicivirga caseinilyticus]|uniref:PspC domain-containing protein n=1 Tax=Carboxylicivirga caseinilyticus TaxID=3417572 RepID=UPI003D32888F|nr:PspC domain-containing protein [Marinilabiliaceae bacterium A049]
MNKTVTININGSQFFIDEDAYARLSDYLKKIELSFKKQESGDEIIKDIESRIAELFEEKIKRETDVVTMQMVEEMISIMGQPEDMTGEEEKSQSSSRPTSTALVKPSKRFYRDIDNRILGGVCAGIAAYFDIDSIIVRIIALILIPFTSGAIILIYLVLWMALPPAITTAQKLEMRGKHITINTIEESIKNEYDEVKKNFKNFKHSETYKKGENFFSRFSKSDKTVLIIVAVILSLFAFSHFIDLGTHVIHAPFAFFSSMTHGIAPTFNHIFFPGALPIILVLLIIGLIFKTIFKVIIYIIAFLLLGALVLKVIFWMFGGFLLMA